MGFFVGGPVSQFKAEWHRLAFLKFVHGGADIDLLCAILATIQKSGKTAREIDCTLRLMGINTRTDFYTYMRILEDQGLITSLKQRDGNWTRFRAIPKAIDELAYRLANDGYPSPIEQDRETTALRHQIAENKAKVDAALKNSGWRGYRVKLRVVK